MTTYDEYGIPVGAYSEPENLTAQAGRLARALFLYRIRPFTERRYHAFRRGEWNWRRLLTLTNALVVLWWLVLHWGERGVFNTAVNSCNWESWEKWEAGANPHRLIFVADPQLIDPHTYPGRPWPLNPLTYKYTDLYLRRTYSRFHTILHPDTIFFLGDLFDGGREWSTRTTKSPDIQYRRYGDDFWQKEYARFGDIFFKHWNDGGVKARPGQPGRKIISSLPGNHDLGFARGVQVGVRNRFNAYFGEGNRIDVIANHTFVSIDSVSLSALGQDSPDQVEDLWRPTKDFLENVKKQKKRLIQRELRVQQGLRPYPGFLHYEIPFEGLAKAHISHAHDDITEFPTILLSHVPLYRNPGTPCGPLREHWPPSPPSAGQPPEHDHRNAIAVRGGYQYQNVLNKEITTDIAEKVGDIRYAFSGDDHDYCEVLHRGFASAGGGIKEITVKSISWAMGIRHPGVVLMSMWNPVDQHGNPKSGDASKTVQTHLCLMPDQIGTFLKYAMLFGFTFTLIVIRAALVTIGIISGTPTTTEAPLLPTSNPAASSAESEKALLSHNASLDPHTHPTNDHHAHSANSSTSSELGSLQVRPSTQARTRAVSPGLTSYQPASSSKKYSFPLVQHAGYHGPDADNSTTTNTNNNNNNSFINFTHPTTSNKSNIGKKVKIYGRPASNSISSKHGKKQKKRRGLGLFWYELSSNLAVVLLAGLTWYFYLVFTG